LIKKYCFDEVIDRVGTNCEKWDGIELCPEDPIALWVADMDFVIPDEAVQAMKSRLDHHIFGYSLRAKGWKSTIINWLRNRHGWNVEREWIKFSPGVVPAIAIAILSYTGEGDGILIQPPIYPPFKKTVLNGSRKLVENPLKLVNGRFEMDYEDLEKKLSSENVKLALLCSPHNPSGRVWKRDEIERFASLCLNKGVIIFSDEIHSDIVYSGNKHIPISSINSDIADMTLTAMSPSKTFNLAGLSTSEIIISNDVFREKYAKTLDFLHIGGGNIFGAIASEAVYSYGEEWLDQLLNYLERNIDFIDTFLSEGIPELKLIRPEGTYVPLIDCRQLGLSPIELESLFRNKAKVILNAGYTFGKQAEGFMRINIAAPRSILAEGLKRIKIAINS
jgi:cystathionine beta-lyase